jgi:proline dehydrogenase
MIDTASKAFFGSLASSTALKNLASRYGMRNPGSFARRFIAGETVDEAIAAARIVEASGLRQTLDLLGEGVSTASEATAATRAYMDVIERIVQSGVGRNISLKLTQLGLTIDRATCVDNLRRIMEVATKHEFFVRIDMENSPYTQITFDVFETVWGLGHRNVGVVLQSCLPRSLEDARRMNALGARVRLVKGAYKEPRGVAYQEKEQVDAAFIVIAKLLLSHGNFPAIATHDPAMIAASREHAAANGITPDRFEFQMLYGIRRDLQAQLASEGFGMRVYIPFGREWFPYFMRRLGERPANVGFVVRGVLGER